MAIITISRGSYSKGKEVAEKTAACLGYDCVAREVLIEASEHFNIPEIKLVRSLHDAPSVLQRFTYGKERYISYIEEAFLERVQQDNVIYHGLAGHFFLKGITHTLKVRIMADMKDRVEWEVERERISAQEALSILKKDDDERRRWSLHLYGVDTNDPHLYDLVVRVGKISVDDAVETICNMAQKESFKATSESRAAMDDLVLAARARVKVMDVQPNVVVSAKAGIVYVDTQAQETDEGKVIKAIGQAVSQVPGLKDIRVNVRPATLY